MSYKSGSGWNVLTGFINLHNVLAVVLLASVFWYWAAPFDIIADQTIVGYLDDAVAAVLAFGVFQWLKKRMGLRHKTKKY